MATTDEMNQSAEAAREELEELVSSTELCSDCAAGITAVTIQEWWKKWYMMAGHTRLAWILMKTNVGSYNGMSDK
jgi:hypothetical protein